MSRLVQYILIVCILFPVSSTADDIAQKWSSVAEIFSKHKVKGTFILYDEQNDVYYRHNKLRSIKAVLPASTFKIFHSLVALETGAIKTPDTMIKWDGVKRMIQSWNQDHTLRSAYRHSTVWFYQEMARRIGKEKMYHYLEAVGYGNATIGEAQDSFWLDNSLKINPQQQIEFLRRLASEDLPFKKETIAAVKEIMIQARNKKSILRAKTGWASSTDPHIGWYVGYVESPKGFYYFAMNMDIKHQNDAKKRVSLTKEILWSLSIFGEDES